MLIGMRMSGSAADELDLEAGRQVKRLALLLGGCAAGSARCERNWGSFFRLRADGRGDEEQQTQAGGKERTHRHLQGGIALPPLV